jgi:beta-exotoxin I transport system ATP-binding protein
VSAIQTAGLTKYYGRRLAVRGRGALVRALEDLSIEVREGEIFGFLGPNGAGKSTMIRVLLGYLHPTAGRASVLGLDIGRESIAIRRRVGYLPGGIALYDTMTGEDLLDYLAALYGRRPVRRPVLLDRLEFSARDLRRLVRDYSRGMRQKMGIIQALQHDPELAILDEPSEGLDPLMQRAFYEILEDLRREGRTIFFSSHVLSEVERICDRVAIIRQGRLVALEEVAALLNRRRRHVEMRLAGEPPRLEGVPGVSHVQVADGMVRLDLEGDVGPFLRAIAAAPITDLTIEPAHLEEAFLEYYAGDGAGRADGRGAAVESAVRTPDESGASTGTGTTETGAAGERPGAEVR